MIVHTWRRLPESRAGFRWVLFQWNEAGKRRWLNGGRAHATGGPTWTLMFSTAAVFTDEKAAAMMLIVDGLHMEEMHEDLTLAWLHARDGR